MVNLDLTAAPALQLAPWPQIDINIPSIVTLDHFPRVFEANLACQLDSSNESTALGKKLRSRGFDRATNCERVSAKLQVAGSNHTNLHPTCKDLHPTCKDLQPNAPL
jgi:hypothetical protein